MRAAPGTGVRADGVVRIAVVLCVTVAVALSAGSASTAAPDDAVDGPELVTVSLQSPSPSALMSVNTTTVTTTAADSVTSSSDPPADLTKTTGSPAVSYKQSSASAPPAGLARVARSVGGGNTLEVELALLKAPPLAAAVGVPLPPSHPASPAPPGQPEYATGADISPPAAPALRGGTRSTSAGGGAAAVGPTVGTDDDEDEDGDDDGEDEDDGDDEEADDGDDEDDDEDGDGEEDEATDEPRKAVLPSPAPAPSPERKRYPPVAEDQLPAADEVAVADERLLELMVRIAEDPENWRHVHSELQTLDQDLSRVRHLEAAARAAGEREATAPSSAIVAEEIAWVPEPQKKAARSALVGNRWEEEEEEGQMNFISPAGVEGVARGAKNRGKGGRPRKKPRRPHPTPPSDPEELPEPDDEEEARRRQLFAAGVLTPAEDDSVPAHTTDGGRGKGRGRNKADSKEKTKNKEKPKDKQRARNKEKEREKELQRERLREKEREKERQRERDREKDLQREKEREKERMREREEREREREMEAMELEREREQREREIQRLKESERERERERARQKEREREFQLERDRERELSAWGKLREKDNRVRPDVENNIHTPDRGERIGGSRAVSFQSGSGQSPQEFKGFHKSFSSGLNSMHSALGTTPYDWRSRGSFDELKQGHLGSGSRTGAEDWPRLPPPEPAVTNDDAGRWPDFSALGSLRHRHHRPRHRQGSALEAALAKHREILANTWAHQRPKQVVVSSGEKQGVPGGVDSAEPPPQRPPVSQPPPPPPPPPAPQKPEDAAPVAAPASSLGSPAANRPWPHFSYHRVTTSPQLLAEAASRPRNAYVAVSLVPSPADGGNGPTSRGHRPQQQQQAVRAPPAVAEGANASRDGPDEALQPLSVRSPPSDPLEKQLAQAAAAAAAAAAGSSRESGAGGGNGGGGGGDGGGARESTMPWSHARHLDRMQEQLRTLSAVEERLRYRWLERERLRQMLRDGGAPGGAGSLLRAPRGGTPGMRSSSSSSAAAAAAP